MSKKNDLNLSESTLESLREYVDDFGMTVDDVVLKLINENKSLKESLGLNVSYSYQTTNQCSF